MKTPLSFRSTGSLLAGLALAAPAAAQQLPATTFSITYQGPTIAAPDCATGIAITEGDILSPCTANGLPAPGPLPVPRISLTGGPGGLGLLGQPGCIGHPPGFACRIEVDALSFGRDHDMTPNASGLVPGGMLLFSVDAFAAGIPSPVMPSVFSEAPVGDISADLFTDFGLPLGPLPPFAVPPRNVGIIDGNGLPSGTGFSYPGLGLREPNPPSLPPTPGDDVDAFDFGDGNNPGTVQIPFFSLDASFVDPLTGVPNGFSALAHGFVGGDVLTLGAGGVPVVYAPAAMLGLDFFGPDTDDLDALILRENFNFGFQPSLQPNQWLNGNTDMLLFSVRRGSAVIGMPDSIFGLPIEPGDILTVPLPTFMGGVSPFPGIYIAAENLGLLTRRTHNVPFGDDINALDAKSKTIFDCDGDGIEDALAIALGIVLDANQDGIPDSCQNTPVGTPYCFCPNGGICVINPDSSAGCRNSSGSGALLSAAGTTSVGADNLVLTTTSMPAFQFGLYFMGTNPVNVLFGDGIRCVGGQTARFLPPQNSGAGGTTSIGPGIVNYTITNMPAFFWITSGQTWRFQNWYRDPLGPCGTGFNFSNAMSVTFTL